MVDIILLQWMLNQKEKKNVNIKQWIIILKWLIIKNTDSSL